MSDNDCEDNEKCENNQCKVLQCTQNQIYKYHVCKTLKFTPLGYIKESRYISYFSEEAYFDYKAVYIAVPSLIAVMLIGLIVYFVIKRAKKKGGKHVIEIKDTKKIKKEKEIEHKTEDIKHKKKKFCNKCGNSLKENEKFCRKCGNKL